MISNFQAKCFLTFSQKPLPKADDKRNAEYLFDNFAYRLRELLFHSWFEVLAMCFDDFIVLWRKF